MFALGRHAFNTEKNPVTKQKYVTCIYERMVCHSLEFVVIHKCMNKHYLCRQCIFKKKCFVYKKCTFCLCTCVFELLKEVFIWKTSYCCYDCPCICQGLIFKLFFPLELIRSSTFICGMARKLNKAQGWYCSFCLSSRRKSCPQNFMAKKWKENTLQWQNKNVQQVRLQLLQESCARDVLPKDGITEAGYRHSRQNSGQPEMGH